MNDILIKIENNNKEKHMDNIFSDCISLLPNNSKNYLMN